MAYISEEEINSIREQSNIVDIISSYIPLNKSGNDYVGVCPFHDDHSPSMHVSTKLNIFKCFVCNAGGNVFSFVKRYENVSYPEAIKIVANKSGITFKYAIDTKMDSKFKNEFTLMDMSHKFYQNHLMTAAGVEAKKYLLSRGINDAIIKEFKIGLSPGNNDLRSFLENKKVNLDLAFELGLLNKVGIEYYDTFVSRIMIPIFDMQGNLAGYTARAYLKDEKNKYINSKETKIYKKSSILFNYHNAKDIARLQKEIIVVEGNMDAIALATSGIKNVIALMGVVISAPQIEALKKLNSKVILLLDSDNAGSLATIKVGDQIQKEGLDLYVVRLSDAKDPDEYIRKFGKAALEENLKHAKKYLDFKLDYLKESKNLDNAQELTKYIEEVVASLENASELEKEVTIAKVCKEYGLDPEVVKKGLVIKPKEVKKPEVKMAKPKRSRYNLACDELIYAMLLNKDYYRIFMNNLGYLKNKVERETVALIGSYIKKHNNIDIAGFIDYVIEYDQISLYLHSVLGNTKNSQVTESEFYDILYTVSRCIDEEEIKALKIKIKEEKDMNKKLELIKELTELKKGCGIDERNKDI